MTKSLNSFFRKEGIYMKMSSLGFKSVRLKDIDNMYPAQDILMKTAQIKQYGSGVYGFDNIPMLVMDNISNVVRNNFNRNGCVEVRMPLLQQEELWKSSNRWDRYINDGVMLSVNTDKGSYGLAPTAEEAITEFVHGKISSYKQLPVYFYQIGMKFRNELRNRGYLYRGKEFLMFDLYTFDVSEEDMNNSYDKIRDIYFDVFKELGLTLVPVAADNGAIGGSKSEEMMVLGDSGEDTILYDFNTKVGINVEVLEREDASLYLDKYYDIKDISSLEKRKAIELGHIFALGTKYSDSMNVKFASSSNENVPYYMGCYGIGISRLLGVIYENNALYEEGKVIGYSLPLSVVPYYLYIICSKDRYEEAYDLYSDFISSGVSVIIDDTDARIGESLRNAKVLGIPYVAILGNNTLDGKAELERTRDNKKEIMNLDKLFDVVSDIKNTKVDYKF